MGSSLVFPDPWQRKAVAVVRHANKYINSNKPILKYGGTYPLK